MVDILIKTLAAIGGVGGVLAALMFYFYDKNEKANFIRLESYNKALTQINLQLIDVIKSNTSSMALMQATTASLNVSVMELTRDLRDRDVYFREHVMPIVARKVNT